jgi:hypothetical protein
MTEREMKVIQNRRDSEIYKIKKKDCIHCFYTTGRTTDFKQIICEYLAMAGKMRPCLPGECRAAGVFKERRKKK